MSSHDTKKVLIVCPVCNTKKLVPIPKNIIKRPEGLTTIQIPSGMICEHSFQIYLDQNFIIRGYNKSDFEVSLVYQDGIKGGGDRSTALEGSFLEFLQQFDDEVAGCMLETILSRSPLFIIGIPSEQQEPMKELFAKTFPEIEKNVFPVSRKEYNTYWKTQVFTSKYKFSVVIDSQLKVIVKSDPIKTKNPLGISILRELEKIRGDKAKEVILTNWYKKFDLFAESVHNLLMKNPKTKRKDIIKFLTNNKKFDEKRIPLILVLRHVYHKYKDVSVEHLF